MDAVKRAQNFASDVEYFAYEVPKAELHVHLEGTMEPELAFELARKNKITLPFKSPKEVHERCKEYKNLDDFLALYEKLSDVIKHREDFRQIVLAYLERVHKQGVRHVEIFLDPQTHRRRGLPMVDIIMGPFQGLEEGSARYSITFNIIPCILRHLSAKEAMDTLREMEPYKQYISALGLAGSERQHSASKFTEVFALARRMGLHVVAHAGEEGGPESVWSALNDIHAERIDHGLHVVDDNALMDELRRRSIPLTLCPFSNEFLKVHQMDGNYPLKRMLEAGLCVTVNSDDPAFFGSHYIGDNFVAVVRTQNLTKRDVHRLALNSLNGCFADPMRKAAMLHECQQFFRYFAYGTEGVIRRMGKHSSLTVAAEYGDHTT